MSRPAPRPALTPEDARRIAQAAADQAGTGRTVSAADAAAMLRLARLIVRRGPPGRPLR